MLAPHRGSVRAVGLFRSSISAAVRMSGDISVWRPPGGCTSSPTPSLDTASGGERPERTPGGEGGRGGGGGRGERGGRERASE